MNKRLENLLLVVGGLLLVGSGVLYYIYPKLDIALNKGSAAVANGVALSFQPSKTTVAINEQFTVDVLTDTKGYSVSATDLRVNFSGAGVLVSSITAGNFLPVILVSGSVGSGKATIILGSQPTAPAQGIGILATITLKATQNGLVQFSFDNNTQVAAIGQVGNVVGAMSSVTIAAGTATPTPTVSASTTPTPTPTQSATPGPTVSPGTFNLREGDMISAAGSSDPDIYIINESGFKRLFLNPIIFSFYGHLGGYAKVKTITPYIRDAFGTSGLFRNCETNDEKIWAVQVIGEDDAVLHHVQVSGAQAVAQDPNFFKKIFCINNNEYYWYPKSLDPYTSLSQIPTYRR